MDPSQVVFKSRLKPGRMLLVDTEEKAVIQDVELKKNIAKSRPHTQWLKEQVIRPCFICYRYVEHLCQNT